MSVQMCLVALHCAHLLHTILHRTDPIILPHPPDNRHCSHDGYGYLREGGTLNLFTLWFRSWLSFLDVLHARWGHPEKDLWEQPETIL